MARRNGDLFWHRVFRIASDGFIASYGFPKALSNLIQEGVEVGHQHHVLKPKPIR